MPYAAGVFSLVAGNPVVTGTIVSSIWANNTLSDIGTGLSTAVLKDGTQTTTAPVPFAQGISGPSGGGALTATSTVSVSGGLSWGTGVISYGKVAKRLTADQTVLVSSLATVPSFSFSIAANEEWQGDYFFSALVTGGAGLRFAVVTPAGATQNIVGAGVVGGSVNSGQTINSGTAINPIATGGIGDGIADLSLWVLNGANAGSVDIQVSLVTVTSTGNSLRKGSHMYATRLA